MKDFLDDLFGAADDAADVIGFLGALAALGQQIIKDAGDAGLKTARRNIESRLRHYETSKQHAVGIINERFSDE